MRPTNFSIVATEKKNLLHRKLISQQKKKSAWSEVYTEDSSTLIGIIAEIGVKSVSYSEKFVGLWVENNF